VNALPGFQKLFAHLKWADHRTMTALARIAAPPPRTIELFAHVLGAEETWLSRIQGRPSSAPVWPAPTRKDCEALMPQVHEAWNRYMAALTEADLERSVHYANSAGAEFDSRVDDILTHVAMHGQNHRGQINAALRAEGAEPNDVDYIAFVRGAPAAVKRSG
jgi:uncharacterized damage-inducible protein DinB